MNPRVVALLFIALCGGLLFVLRSSEGTSSGSSGPYLASANDPLRGLEYHQRWEALLIMELGPYVASAIYDPNVLLEAIRRPNDYMWDVEFFLGMHKGGLPGLPKGIHTPGHQMVYLKRAISLSLGRMHRDVGMRDTYLSVRNHGELALFDRAVRHVIGAQARHFAMIAQAIVDQMPAELRTRYAAQASRPLRHARQDPFFWVMSRITALTSPGQAADMLQDISGFPASAVNTNTADRPIRMERVLYPMYTNQPYERQGPEEWKFFSYHRPTGSCSSIQRECEKPDGCRFICNVDYFQSQTQDGKHQGLRFLGLGSANDFDWEMSILRLFSAEQPTGNAIRSITTFDCTIGAFNPPSELKTLPVGFAGAEICLGSELEKKFIGFDRLKAAVLNSEVKGKHFVARGLGKSPEDRIINRHKMGVLEGMPGLAFDAVAIFKIDIEGWEFAILPAWARADIVALGSSAAVRQSVQRSKSRFAYIDFEKEVDFFSVSQVLMETHASGTDVKVMWHVEHMILQMHQMGFFMVFNEKNFYSSCCYETVFVHYRFFVRSEIFAGQNLP